MFLQAIRSNVRVIRAISSHTDQLACGIKKAFNNQLGLAWVRTFERDVQILADTLDCNVGRSNALCTFRKDVMPPLNSLDPHSFAEACGLEFNCLRDRFSINQSNSDWTDAHDSALFVRQVNQGITNAIFQTTVCLPPLTVDGVAAERNKTCLKLCTTQKSASPERGLRFRSKKKRHPLQGKEWRH